MEANFIDQLRAMCPIKSKVYYNQNVSSISVFLDSDIGVVKRDALKCNILSFVGSKMLHDSIKTVNLYW